MEEQFFQQYNDYGYQEPDEIAFMECETCEVYIPNSVFERLMAIAFRDGVTVSWLLRSLLGNPFDLEIPHGIKRPKKFKGEMHRFPICMYGADKQLWKIRMVAQGSEFGAYVRYLLEVYDDYLDDMNLQEGLICEAEDIEKEFGTVTKGISYGYQLLMWVNNPANPERTLSDPFNNRIKSLFGRYKKRFTRAQIKSMLNESGFT